LSQMTGDESPRPGTSAFHLTFLVSLHSIGGDALAAVPFPVGPRQWAQFSASAKESRNANTTARHTTVLKMGTSEFSGTADSDP
jgi:hypothetical protein